MKQKRYIKFSGVMIDECITWKDHIGTVENKIAKNLGWLYRAKELLNSSSPKSIYFLYIPTYLTTQTLYAQVHKKPN